MFLEAPCFGELVGSIQYTLKWDQSILAELPKTVTYIYIHIYIYICIYRYALS